MKRPVVFGALLVLPLLFSITIFFPDIFDIFEDLEDFPMEVQEVKKGTPVYVGGQTCVTCHTNEFEQWSGSHHDLAMQEATQDTVLGDFNNTTFTNFGLTSTFSQNDGRFFVRTDGPDGKLAVEPQLGKMFSPRVGLYGEILIGDEVLKTNAYDSGFGIGARFMY